jgi:hypothetical protein
MEEEMKSMVCKIASVALFSSLACTFNANAATIASSDFNDGTVQGWTCVGVQSCTNPGTLGATTGTVGDGYLRVVDLLSSTVGAGVLAPSSFHSGPFIDPNMVFSFDFAAISNNGSAPSYNVAVHLRNGNLTVPNNVLSATFDTGVVPDIADGWVHIEVPINFSDPGWLVGTNFDPLSVTGIRIEGEYWSGVDIVGFDNFLLETARASAPNTTPFFAVLVVIMFVRRHLDGLTTKHGNA